MEASISFIVFCLFPVKHILWWSKNFVGIGQIIKRKGSFTVQFQLCIPSFVGCYASCCLCRQHFLIECLHAQLTWYNQNFQLLSLFLSSRTWNLNFSWFLQVFGEKSFEKFGKYFISMHFSDQHSGMHKKMLLFKFALPDANNMADISRLVALVPYYIDTIGRYKLSSQVNFIHTYIYVYILFRSKFTKF